MKSFSIKSPRPLPLFILMTAFFGLSLGARSQNPIKLTPKCGGDGTFQTVTIENQAYYQVTDLHDDSADLPGG